MTKEIEAAKKTALKAKKKRRGRTQNKGDKNYVDLCSDEASNRNSKAENDDEADEEDPAGEIVSADNDRKRSDEDEVFCKKPKKDEQIYLLKSDCKLDDNNIPKIDPINYYKVKKSIQDLSGRLKESNRPIIAALLQQPEIEDGLNEICTLNLQDLDLVKESLMRFFEKEKNILNWNCSIMELNNEMIVDYPNLLSWVLKTPAQLSYEKVYEDFARSGLREHIENNLNRMLANYFRLVRIPDVLRKMDLRLNCSLIDYNVEMSEDFQKALSERDVFLLNWFFSKESIVSVESTIHPGFQIRHTPFFYSRDIDTKS